VMARLEPEVPLAPRKQRGDFFLEGRLF
jgi:hypothetical protein